MSAQPSPIVSDPGAAASRGPNLVLVKPAAESAAAGARRLHEEASALGRAAVASFMDALKAARAEGLEVADLHIVAPGVRERARRLADYLDMELRSLTALQDRLA